jgi:hypothetical protein
MGSKSHTGHAAHTRSPGRARPERRRDGHRPTERRGPAPPNAPGKASSGDEHDQATTEEFDREGMGVAAKE